MMDTPTNSDLASLAATVAEMRRLGVTRWGAIELGPEPSTASPNEDETQRTDADRLKLEREERLRFGASGGPRPHAVR